MTAFNGTTCSLTHSFRRFSAQTSIVGFGHPFFMISGAPPGPSKLPPKPPSRTPRFTPVLPRFSQVLQVPARTLPDPQIRPQNRPPGPSVLPPNLAGFRRFGRYLGIPPKTSPGRAPGPPKTTPETTPVWPELPRVGSKFDNLRAVTLQSAPAREIRRKFVTGVVKLFNSVRKFCDKLLVGGKKLGGRSEKNKISSAGRSFFNKNLNFSEET